MKRTHDGEHARPLVSVIIPAYNRGRVLPAAIDSVRNQTYAHTEIIVVDDGSTDNTEKIMAAYAGAVTCYRKPNGGCSSARNYGIVRAHGDYIALLDSDDTWHPQKLEKQMRCLAGRPDCAAAITDIAFVNERDETVSVSQVLRTVGRNGFMLDEFLRMPALTCSYMLVKRRVFDEVGLFDEGFPTANDFEMMLRICSRFKVAVAAEPLVRYRKSPDSVSRRVFSGNRLRAIEKLEARFPAVARAHAARIRQAKARIHLSYADDLLWHCYLREARKEMARSLRFRFSSTAVKLYAKSLLMDLVSPALPFYRDKGVFKGS
jgi:glycosyltransferase involved in cell wall biosynthesis